MEVERKMLVKQELIDRIKDYFDLNIYETKVWLALLGKGIASAGEVASISKVPRSRTYDVLESLEKKGFAIVKLGKPVKYIGIKPRIVLEKMKNNVKKSAEDKIKDLGKIKETQEYVTIEDLYRKGINPIKREDISAALSGRSNISSYLKEILENTQKEVIICAKAEEIKSKENLFAQTIKRLNQNKIKIKIALSGDEKITKQLEKSFGVKIKRTEINAKFFIVDRKEILFYLYKDKDKRENAVWINSIFFAEAFASLFEKAIKN